MANKIYFHDVLKNVKLQLKLCKYVMGAFDLRSGTFSSFPVNYVDVVMSFSLSLYHLKSINSGMSLLHAWDKRKNVKYRPR